MRKRWYVTSFAIVLSFALVACGNNDASTEVDEEVMNNFNAEGYPIVDEPIEVSGFAAKFYSEQDWNDLMLWDEHEKLTNIKVSWDTVTTDILTERRNLMLASGEYPDMMFATALAKSDLLQYGSQGTLVAINEYIDEYAPNFKKVMEEYPVVAQGVTMPDGNIYGFPAIFDPDFKGLNLGTPWINENWLEAVGMENPETLDELYEVLLAFKEQDPNGNGEADEIPWGAQTIDSILNYLRGAFELNNRGTANIHLDEDPDTGGLRFIPTSDNYRALLEYVNKLYSSQLIDLEIFTHEHHEFSAKTHNGLYGLVGGIDPNLNTEDLYSGINVLEGINGEKLSTTRRSPLGNLGMFVITDKAENPAALVRWMDYFYSDEGAKNFFLGFEGITYEQAEDGSYQFVEEITDNPDGLNFDQAISQYLTWPGGYYPGIVKEDYFKGTESNEATRANAENAEPYSLTVDDVWPGFNYTIEEQNELTTLQNDIHSFIEESQAEFITGRRSFDDWDNYLTQLERMGLERYMEINQQAFERMIEQ